jgi:hypothetical protein
LLIDLGFLAAGLIFMVVGATLMRAATVASGVPSNPNRRLAPQEQH